MLTTANIHTDAATPFEAGKMETVAGFYLAIGRPGSGCTIFLSAAKARELHAATGALVALVDAKEPRHAE